MADLYLIAHKVRGLAAFDVAERMPCPECRTYEYVEHMAVAESNMGCDECDSLGFWWIIPTSGHRAYPYFAQELRLLIDWEMARIHGDVVGEMPSALPDHYPHSTPGPKLNLAQALGLHRRPPPKIDRRI